MKILFGGKALLVGLEKLDIGTLDSLPDLKVIGCNMTGTEHLPIEEIKKRGIKLISLKGETQFLETITSTAEHTIGLTIALLRNYKTALNAPYQNRESYKGSVLSQKKIGIIGGNGRIGKQVKKLAEGLRMKSIVYDHFK